MPCSENILILQEETKWGMSMRKGIVRIMFLMLLCSVATGFAQNGRAQTYTVSGYVTDGNSKETLLTASVYDANTMRGSVTNNFGYYTLVMPAGHVDLHASYVGYSKYENAFLLRCDTVINIQLDASIALREVAVVGRAIENNVTGTQMSTIEIPILQMKKVPAIFGETDIIKTLQLLPGVQSGTEGSAGMYVRGGGPDENLMLLDGVPLYNVNHAMGFFSAFNPDAIKNVTLFKGNFPARFGGRLSSVVDVRTKDGDMQSYHGNFSIGAIAAKMNVEGPIVKDKTSFNLSFRRTYYDLLAAPLINMIVKNESENMEKTMAGYYFYDFNLKLNHKFSDKDRLFMSYYSGDDRVYVDMKEEDAITYNNGMEVTNVEKLNTKWRWGNRVAALRWNHVVSPQLFMNVTGTYTQYRHLMNVDYDEECVVKSNGVLLNNEKTGYELGLKSGIYDLCGKVDFDYRPHEKHDVKFGFDVTHHLYEPSATAIRVNDEYSSDNDTNDNGTTINLANARIGAWETDLYAEDNWDISNFIKLNLGLHYSTFSVEGKTYHSVQPRASLRALASENLSFKAGYASMTQYIHLLSSNTISLPTDLWVPVTQNLLPMDAHQVAVGAFYDWKGFEFSLEGYCKFMKNVVEYKDGASFFSLDATDWQEKVCMGDGYSYGVEFLVQRSVGKVTGWLGYTWARANRLFNRQGQELNFGEMFPAKYDRRHDLSIVLSYAPSERFDVSATWVYSSGNCATLAMQNYSGLDVGSSIGYVSCRNNYRLNSYQRLDIGVNWHKQKKYGERTWSLNVYNALCHNNPFIVYPKLTYDYNEQTTKKQLVQVCIFPLMPSLSYSFQF